MNCGISNMFIERMYSALWVIIIYDLPVCSQSYMMASCATLISMVFPNLPVKPDTETLLPVFSVILAYFPMTG